MLNLGNNKGNTIMYSIDLNHIWHPYASVTHPNHKYKIKSAKGVYLVLNDDTKLIDGMSSWWSVIHGYNEPKLNNAIKKQLKNMSHVMFGGLTHEPAIQLAKNLLTILDDSFQHIFFADSGSVSVEVAMKMALQYHFKGEKTTKTKFLTVQSGYHGDTFGAMSVCDPVTGMHSIFNKVLHKNIFISKPKSKFNEAFDESELLELKQRLHKNHNEIAAIIIEPIVQGAGGMRFYHPKYLESLRELCDTYDILLIFDEIATGFGRTGKLFAYEHTKITPDIITVGKALTGGYMTMAATITTSKVAKGIEQDGDILMHGPTFMANPLACAVANASIELLLESNWQKNVSRIESYLQKNLTVCLASPLVKEVRVIGAIGVVELKNNIDMQKATQSFIKNGVWIRPFGKLVYIMPPYITTNKELQVLIDGIKNTLEIL
jgi:adenosylmethionine-8-amino-7-oxononanoate aminotransferase